MFHARVFRVPKAECFHCRTFFECFRAFSRVCNVVYIVFMIVFMRGLQEKLTASEAILSPDLAIQTVGSLFYVDEENL